MHVGREPHTAKQLYYMQMALGISEMSIKQIESIVLNRLFYSTLVPLQSSLMWHCPTEPWWTSSLIHKRQGYICRNYQFTSESVTPRLTWLCPFPQGPCLRSCAYWPCSFNCTHNDSWKQKDLRGHQPCSGSKEHVLSEVTLTTSCWSCQQLRGL